MKVPYLYIMESKMQLSTSQNREFATIIGDILGMLYLLLGRYIFHIPIERKENNPPSSKLIMDYKRKNEL